MTKNLAVERLRLNLATWAEANVDPSAGAGVPAAIGSLWQSASPVGLFFKQNSTDAFGWVRQNLTRLGVFNVKFYGATGNGATDDTLAINTAVSSANSAGGGIVYFPPGTYRVTKPASGLGSIRMQNMHNIVFLGDGYASMIQMNGSAGGGDWYMFRVQDGSSSIYFMNLRLDGSLITNPDPAEQNHLVNVEGAGADTHGGPNDVHAIGVYFTTTVGDCWRIAGNSGNHQVSNVSCKYAICDAPNTRSFVGCQRDTHAITVSFCWARGPTDQKIDFEPTGVGGPETWNVIGNMFDHESRATDVITTAGIGSNDPTQRCIFSYNIVSNGGGIFSLDDQRLSFVGNISEVTAATGAGAILLMTRFLRDILVDGNIFIADVAPAGVRDGIKVVFGSGNIPQRVTITNNIVEMTNTGKPVFCESVLDTNVSGNLLVGVNAIAQACQFNADGVANNDGNAFVGNLVINVGNTFTVGCNFHGNGFNVANSMAYANLFDGAAVAVSWSRGGTETFSDYRLAADNLLVAAGSTGLVTAPPTNVGATLAGNAGPGVRLDQISTAAGPEGNITAPSGAMCTNTSGGANATVFYKETGTGNTGWLRVGAAELVAGALAGSTDTGTRFFAPGGMDLATESTTQIQWGLPRNGTLRNMRVKCIAGTGGGTNTYRIRKNGVNTTINVAMLNTAANGNDTSNTATAVAGDLIDVIVTKDVAPTTPQAKIVVSYELAD
jgi:pectate lyase-like protein